VIDFRRHRAGGVFQEIDASRVERPFVHPHDIRPEAVTDLDLANGDHVAAADIDFVRKGQGD
jgi:hypothetical protein